MAIAIYQDLQGRQYWADSTSENTLEKIAGGTWVLYDDTPGTPPPPPVDPFDDEVAERIDNLTSKTSVRLRAASGPLGDLRAFNIHQPHNYGTVDLTGVADSSAAIKAMEAALTSGATAHFPHGSYRFAQQNPAGGAAFLISGKSSVTVSFEPGAEILMDNLDGAGHGTSHGISVVGTGSDIALHNPKVRWATQPSARSTGEAFHFLGYPSDNAPAAGWTGSTGKLTNIRLINATAMRAPQTGALFKGCSDVVVESFAAENTLGDGLHFNACRRINHDGLFARNTGDDGIAFVTYHHATVVWQDAAVGPFNQNGLTAWCNSGTADGIFVDGSLANGCRVSGVRDLAIGRIVSVGAAVAGFALDAAIAGGAVAWSYKASRGVSVADLVLRGGNTGLLAETPNISSAADDSWWRFDVRIAGVTVNETTSWALRTEGDGSTASAIAGLHFGEVKVTTGVSGGEVGFSALRDSSIARLTVRSLSGATVGFYGQDAPHAGALAALPSHNVIIGSVEVDGARLLVQDFRRLIVETVRVRNAPGSGIELVRLVDSSIDVARVVNAHRGNTGLSRGIMFQKTANVDVGALAISHDANTGGTWVSMEIGGGDATDPAANGLRIEKVVYTNTINQTDSDVVVQGGPDAPINHYAKVQFFNGGETSPVWRTQTVGTLPVF